MKYKLIKEYPGSPKAGSIIDNLENDWIENYSEFWEIVVEKDYEILSFINQNKSICKVNETNYLEKYVLSNLHVFSIHSVKRSDGEIFTIGDNIEFNIHSYKKAIAIITSFKLYGDKLCFLNNDLMYNASLDIIGNKIKQPLFTTEDGVDIFEGSTFTRVDIKQWKIWAENSEGVTKNYDKKENWDKRGILHFSTKEKAEEYILMNKPVLSLNDLKQFFPDTYIPFKKGESATEDINTKQLEDLVKSKIQQSV